MNKISEIRFGKREKPDVIDPKAYSQDGYLIHQGRLDGVRYGRKTSKESGCGWIACYNFLRFMGRPEPPLRIAHKMESMLLWGGHIGSHPLAVWWYLHRKGFRFRFACTRRGMNRLVNERGGRLAGVIGYGHKSGAHYVTFIREEAADPTQNKETKLRFLNAVYGVENHRLTVDEFFQKYVKWKLCFVIVAK